MTYQRNETPEPLAQGQAGEMAVVAYLVTNLSSGEPSLCFEDERGDYGDEDHMPVFEALCRLSDATAAPQAKDAEIAGLKADAGRYRWLSTNYVPPGDLHEDFDSMDKAVAVGGRMLDDAIDAAVSASGEGGQ